MELHVDDDGFVRAPAADCYRVLTHVAAWGTWWPDTRVTDLGDDRAGLVIGGRRGLQVEVTAHAWRHDQGFRVSMAGDCTGNAEWWLEPGWGGTVVHHLATCAVGGAAAARHYRRWLRTGLWGLKDHVQAAVLDREASV